VGGISPFTRPLLVQIKSDLIREVAFSGSGVSPSYKVTCSEMKKSGLIRGGILVEAAI